MVSSAGPPKVGESRPQEGSRSGSGRWLRGLLLLAIITQSCQAYIFQGFNTDKVIQASAGQSWLDGFGFSAPVVDPAGLVTREPIVQWPPGYSAAYAFALRGARDPFVATCAVDVVATILFLGAWWQLFAALGPTIDRRVRVIFWAYWAVAYSAITGLPSSDLMAAACYFAATALVIAPRRCAASMALAGVAGGAAAAARFAYWPLVWVPLVPLFMPPRRGVLKMSGLYAVAAIAPMAWAAITNLRATGSITSLPSEASAAVGLHWRHILSMPPFGASVLGIDVAWRRLAVGLPAIRFLLPPAFWGVTGVIVVIGTMRAWHEVAHPLPDVPRRALAVCGALTFTLTMALVTLLALRVPAYADGWNYMTDAARYLAPSYPFLLLALVLAALDERRPVAILAVSLLTISGVSVTGYRVGQLGRYATKNSNGEPSGPQSRAQIRAVFDAVRHARTGGSPVLYCDSSLLRQSIAMMAGAAAPRVCPDSAGASPSAHTLFADVSPAGDLRLVVR